MTPHARIRALVDLLDEENLAVRAGDLAAVARLAPRKEAAVAALARMAPRIEELRRAGGPAGAEIEAHLAALEAPMRRNARLVAHAARAAREVGDLIGGRIAAYDARGAQPATMRSGGVLNKSL